MLQTAGSCEPLSLCIYELHIQLVSPFLLHTSLLGSASATSPWESITQRDKNTVQMYINNGWSDRLPAAVGQNYLKPTCFICRGPKDVCLRVNCSSERLLLSRLASVCCDWCTKITNVIIIHWDKIAVANKSYFCLSFFFIPFLVVLCLSISACFISLVSIHSFVPSLN
jgi:hypothetical protein